MKLLTVVIPSFNSEAYLQHCLESLLIGRDDELDVIVVNDGSSDHTSAIAHEFASKHPFCSVIDKANGGHGSGINVGLSLAKGLYFKVLDSDDTFDQEGLIHLLNVIKIQNDKKENPDFYLADYCSYNDFKSNPTAVLSFRKSVKSIEKVISWEQMPRVRTHDFFMIHMVFAKTAMLQSIHKPLLEKTFYEDNQLMFYILKDSKTLYYCDLPVYKYLVGRQEQSTSLENIKKRYEHQYRVMTSVMEHIRIDEYQHMDKYHQWHIRHELFMISILPWFYTYIGKGKGRHKNYVEHIRTLKQLNPEMYRVWHNKTMSWLLWMCPPPLRHFAAICGYKIFAKWKGWK